MFITVTSASYAGLPAEKTAEASALINVARNLGGSVGISIAGTVLARSEQVHQSHLVAHLVPSAAPYQEAVRQATATLARQGMPPVGSARSALAVIFNSVQQQAALLSYIDVFTDFALIAAVLVPVALIMLRPQTGAAPAR